MCIAMVTFTFQLFLLGYHAGQRSRSVPLLPAPVLSTTFALAPTADTRTAQSECRKVPALIRKRDRSPNANSICIPSCHPQSCAVSFSLHVHRYGIIHFSTVSPRIPCLKSLSFKRLNACGKYLLKHKCSFDTLTVLL